MVQDASTPSLTRRVRPTTRAIVAHATWSYNLKLSFLAYFSRR